MYEKLKPIHELLTTTESDDSDANPRNIPYSEILDNLAQYEITEEVILQYFRDVVIAHMATGVTMYLMEAESSPLNSSGLIDGGKDLIQLYHGILDAQERLAKKEKSLKKKKIPKKEEVAVVK